MVRLKHQVYGTELENIMERFIQKIKDIGVNVLIMMIASHVDQKVAIDSICYQLDQNVYSVFLHMKTDRIKLMKFN